MKISYGSKITSTSLAQRDFKGVLERIKSSQALKSIIETLRTLPENDRQEFKKIELPYFIIAEFNDNQRAKNKLKKSFGLVLDCDHLESNELQTLKQRLKEDCAIACYFTSPGGNGLKIITLFDEEVTDSDTYTKIYKAYALLFSLRYGIVPDKQTIDVSRACFLSYDPDIYINEEAEPICVKELLCEYQKLYPRKDHTSSLTKDCSDEALNNAIDFLIDANNKTGDIYNYYLDWQILGLAIASMGKEVGNVFCG